MSDTYDIIFRQVVLRANQLQANSASGLATNYGSATLDDTEMGDRAVEFPKTAIDDAILNAGDRIVGEIGLNPMSPYRSNFQGVTSNLSSGSLVPMVDSNSKSRVGLIGDVKDASTSAKLQLKSYEEVDAANRSGLVQNIYWFFTDNTRIWHTRTDIVADVVIWDKADQRALLNSNPRGACPFPQNLHEALVSGALSYIFRKDFNSDQVKIWKGVFDEVLTTLCPK
jgi:hypothetical protein